MKYLFLLPLFAAFFLACGNETTSDYGDEKDMDYSETSEHDGIHFGEKIDAEGIMSYDEVIAMLHEKDSVPAKLMASVIDVCQKKGCWMNIESPDGTESEPLFVQFHDYSFFVPLELTGNIIIEGYAYRDVTSVADLQHYAEDAGESEDYIASITEPKEQLKFMANGVKILQ
ncbi:MAG: DUF4920 domain-containing protein [Saprospirales bacterium]|nr:MAG: DUF4920 domain-containing protein [Saprospirales bacterium]